MVVGGAPVPAHPVDAAVRVARLALDMVDFVQGYTDPSGLVVRIRIGMSTGDVTATVMVGRGGGRKRCGHGRQGGGRKRCGHRGGGGKKHKHGRPGRGRS